MSNNVERVKLAVTSSEVPGEVCKERSSYLCVVRNVNFLIIVLLRNKHRLK